MADRGRQDGGQAPFDWLMRVVRPRPAPVPWLRAGRAAIAMAAPFGFGLAAGQGAFGLLASLGTIPAAMSDRGGAYRLRLLRVAMAIVAGGLGLLMGGAVRGHGWVTAGVVTGIGAIAGLLSSAGAAFSGAMLNLMIFTVVGSGRLLPGPIWLAPGLIASGGSFALSLVALEWLARGRAPERQALGDTYAAIADQLAAAGSPRAEAARQALTSALNTAYDAVFAVRLRAGGRSRASRRLVVALLEATPLVEGANALAYAGTPAPRGAIEAVRRLAEAAAAGAAAPAAPQLSVDSPAMAELDAGLKTAGQALADPSGQLVISADWQPAPALERVRQTAARVVGGPAAWLTALRLTICLAVAETLTEVVAVERSYWVALTVAVVVKPDFGSVFARGVQRALGTAVGVVLGAAVLTLVPFGAPLLPFLVLYAALLPIGAARNYGLAATFISPLILILIDSFAHQTRALLEARLIDTLLGCGIVLVLGYALWPETWRPRLPARLAATIDAVREYLTVALQPASGDGPPRRRRAYRALSDLRTALQQTMAEPARPRVQAVGLWPATVALERVTDAIATAAVAVRRDHGASPVEHVDELAAELAELASAVRAGRPPPPSRVGQRAEPTMKEELAGVAHEIDIVRALIGGPDEAGSSPHGQGRTTD